MIRGKNTQQLKQEWENLINEAGITEEVAGTKRNGFNVLLEMFCFTSIMISHYEMHLIFSHSLTKHIDPLNN